MKTAACIIIGDEILSGRVRDTNSTTLARFLRETGVSLERVMVIGDDIQEIAESVRYCADRWDYVVTSGGIGPTHDDLTIEGVARAFEADVVQDPMLSQLIKSHFGDDLPDAALKMAEVPEGSRLLENKPYPTIAYRNVFVLPGIPELFQRDLAYLREYIEGGPPIVMAQIFLTADESRVASILRAIAVEHPIVKIGSYPRWRDRNRRMLVTLEAVDGRHVRKAFDALMEVLPPGLVVTVESG